jgi:sulfide:quinone oxidoreductase
MTASAQAGSAARRRPGDSLRVLVIGGGVAALEAVLALGDLAAGRVSVVLLAPEPRFWYRPLSVAEPFGRGKVDGLELAEVTAASGAQFVSGTLAAVEPDRHRARTDEGTVLDYDVLLLATGARPVDAVRGALTFRGPADTTALGALLTELGSGWVRHVVFALPGGVSWPLPLYELALLTTAFLAERDLRDVEVVVATPEEAPLGLFGPAASEAVGALLEERGVTVLTSSHPVSAARGKLTLAPRRTIPADKVVALPRLQGRPIRGIPRDREGFVPSDAFGRVRGLDDVFAAGDATTFPIKQGGLAAAQARAAAEAIAAQAGADVTPEPFRPVLRGLLLTGAQPRYLRTELAGGLGETSVAQASPLWWPPGKIVGRHLGPFLAERANLLVTPPSEGAHYPVEVDLSSSVAPSDA